jgi:hypothetical protein
MGAPTSTAARAITAVQVLVLRYHKAAVTQTKTLT